VDGLGTLLRLMVRTSRWFWLPWLVGLIIVVPATAAAYEQVFPDPATATQTIESLSGNPTMRAMLGPPTSLIEAGGFTVWRVGTFVATVAGLMTALGVIRTTRADEEAGRVELLRSAVVGRHAPLAASLVIGLGASLLLGLAITGSMVAVGTEAAGSLMFGLGTGLTAAVFVGVGAVAAQLSSSARAARGGAITALLTAYLLRAVADGAPQDSPLRPLHWLSPVEWMALTRPYAGERPLVLLLPVVLTVLLIGLAVVLEGRRDHGSGLWAARPGRARALPSLAGPFALAWRLHRNGVAAWTVGLLIFGALMGSVATGFEQMLSDTPRLAEILRRMGQGADVLTDAFFVAMLSILVIVVAVFGMQLFGRLRHEEEVGHAEAVLATAVSRTRFAASHLVPALVAPTVLLPLVGALLGTALAVTERSWDPVWAAALGGVALLPGVWLSVGLIVLLHGVAPHLIPLAWAVIAWSLVVAWVGAILGLPEWLTELTPFAQLSAYPVEPFTVLPFLVTTAIAAVLVAVGLVGYARRDIQGR
jgi:ABC-2 type transport system permease protein